MSSTRDTIRAAISSSSSMQPKTKLIDFFGQQVEIRQLDFGKILDFRSDELTTKQRMVATVISYVYVPGTDELVFESTDEEWLLKLPFGADWQRLQSAISELTNVDIATKEAEKNSSGTDSATK